MSPVPKIQFLAPLGDLLDESGKPTPLSDEIDRLRRVYHAAPEMYAALVCLRDRVEDPALRALVVSALQAAE